MSSAFIQALNTHTLCTWYVLPFLELNKYNFQEANFIDSYLNRNGTLIAVDVCDWNLCPGVSTHKQFIKREDMERCDRLIFKRPEIWSDDMRFFLSGAYSKMSEYAKQKIRENSGLRYGITDANGHRKTDAILLALDKSPKLKEQWEIELTTPYARGPELPDNLELLSLPQERMFAEINT